MIAIEKILDGACAAATFITELIAVLFGVALLAATFYVAAALVFTN